MSLPLRDILARRRADFEADRKSDFKTALVVQGGGMRGVYSMAALMALEEAGFGTSFDYVIGSSAGAINGAYFLANQARLAVTVYLDDISNKLFINFLRFPKTVEIDYLVDVVLKKNKALDVEKVYSSKTVLEIVLTDYWTSNPFTVTNRDTDVDLMEALRATAAMPMLYNKVVHIRGRDYIDGGVSDLLPLDSAITLGCTNIVTILTCPLEFRRGPLTGVSRLLVNGLMRRHPVPTRTAILSEHTRFNRAMDLIESSQTSGDPARITAVFPSDVSRMVSRITANRNKLLDCALMARKDTRATLGLPPLENNPWPSRTVASIP